MNTKVYIVKRNQGMLTVGDIVLESEIVPQLLKEFLRIGVLEESEGELLFDKSSDVQITQQ